MQKWLVLLLSIATLFISSVTYAEAERFIIEYPSAGWNNSPTEVDTAHLFVKKQDEGRFVKVLVSETAPDSSIFTGDFAIDFDSQSTTELGSPVEVFIPPSGDRVSNESVQAFSAKVKAGKIQASPTLLTPKDGKLRLDVYDTQEQLDAAKQIIADQKTSTKLADDSKQALDSKKANQQLTKPVGEKAKAIAEAAKNVSEQQISVLKQQQLEMQKRELQKQRMKQLKQFEIKKAQNESEYYAERGRNAYNNGNFILAEKYFRHATEINPDKDDFYLLYGISLYRNEKLNEAMAILKIADNNIKNRVEAIYYQGLIEYNNKNYKAAIPRFDYVKTSKKAFFAASAAFYKGLCLMLLDDLEPAKTEFEWVLDNSKDSKLDARAEEYIERIIKLVSYRRKTASKVFIDAIIGTTYDSNILLTSDVSGSTDSATDEGGLRVFGSGELGYMFFRRETYNWKTSVDTYYMYSLNDEFVSADPWQTTVNLEYNSTGNLKNKRPYTLQVNPYYETLFMDTEETGTRENILNAFGVDISYTVVEKSDYFIGYGGSIQVDDSLLDTSTGDDDADAVLYNINNSHTVYVDAEKKRAVIGSLDLYVNAAKGDNKSYNKLQVSATYLSPLKKWENATWTTTLAAYKIRYADSDAGRRDTNFSLAGTISKPLKDSDWTLVGYADLANNTSNAEANHYSKHSVMLYANYSWAQ